MATGLMLAKSTDTLPDEQVVERVLGGETEWFEVIMRRYNQRLYRVTRAIIRDDHEAEDIIQDTYVRAYQHLRQFAGKSKFSTWLTRIAIHEALARSHRRKRFADLSPAEDDNGDPMDNLPANVADPEANASNHELGRLLETAIDALPDRYRAVFMLRDVEQLSTEEAAACLEITEENVKTRLHRARAMLRRDLYARVASADRAAFPFMGARCDRMVERVFASIRKLSIV